MWFRNLLDLSELVRQWRCFQKIKIVPVGTDWSCCYFGFFFFQTKELLVDDATVAGKVNFETEICYLYFSILEDWKITS